MKNYSILCGLLASVSLQPVLFARGEGGAFAGALGGSLMGSMVSSAIASDSRRKHTSDDAEQVRIDQERQRVNQLEREMDRREMERKLSEAQSQQGHSTLFMVLMALVIVLLFGVLAVGILVLRKRP